MQRSQMLLVLTLPPRRADVTNAQLWPASCSSQHW